MRGLRAMLREKPGQALLALGCFLGAFVALILAVFGCQPVSASILRTGPLDFYGSQFFADCWWDPALFMRGIDHFDPYPYQADLCREITERKRHGAADLEVILKKSRGTGGTAIAVELARWFIVTREDAKGLDTAPGWSQIEDVFWSTFARVHAKSELPRLGIGRIKKTEFSIGPDWMMIGKATHEDVRIEGFHSPTGMLLVYDEAKGIRPGVFEALSGTLTSPETLQIVVSTTGFEFGHFHKLWTDPDSAETIKCEVPGPRALRERIPGMAKLERELRKKFGVRSDAYRSQWLAKWKRLAKGGIIPWADVERAMQRHDAIMAGLITPEGPRHSSLDIAASDDGDRSVLGNFVGNDLIEVHVWQIRDTREMEADAFMRARRWGSKRIRPDAPGIGMAVCDGLRHAVEKHGVEMQVDEYWEGKPPADRESDYASRHAEAVNELALKMKAGRVAIPRNDSDGNPIPWAELMQYRQKATDDHRYAIVKKGADSHGKATKSPDFGDMLAIGLAPESPDRMDDALGVYRILNAGLEQPTGGRA